MRCTRDVFCALDHRLSPSTNARPADRMAMLSLAKATSSTTMAMNGQIMASSRLLRESGIHLNDSNIVFPYEGALCERGRVLLREQELCTSATTIRGLSPRFEII